MDDLLHFSGNVQKITVETAPIQKGTFSDKEGKKTTLLTALYNENGEIVSRNFPDKIENYVYYNKQLICLHVAEPGKDPIYKDDYFYNEDLLTRKTRVNKSGHIVEEEVYYYDTEGNLLKKQSKFMTYEYLYSEGLLIEERWHSDLSLNQIIKYNYTDRLLTAVQHYSGAEVPGRRIEYRRQKNGFITEEIIYSASNLVISHFKYEYTTIYKNNWIKRVKYTLHSQNKRKDATEAQYRDILFFEEKESDPREEIVDNVETGILRELEFDNGIYNGDVVDGQMHGLGDFIFNSGTRYQGSFKNNKMEGKGKLTYISGKIYEGTFINNILEGPGACKWENGDFYAGEFKNGQMHGRGCYIWENGNRFEGIFENNRRTEQGILYKRSELESDAPPEWVNELFKES